MKTKALKILSLAQLTSTAVDKSKKADKPKIDFGAIVKSMAKDGSGSDVDNKTQVGKSDKVVKASPEHSENHEVAEDIYLPEQRDTQVLIREYRKTTKKFADNSPATSIEPELSLNGFDREDAKVLNPDNKAPEDDREPVSPGSPNKTVSSDRELLRKSPLADSARNEEFYPSGPQSQFPLENTRALKPSGKVADYLEARASGEKTKRPETAPSNSSLPAKNDESIETAEKGKLPPDDIENSKERQRPFLDKADLRANEYVRRNDDDLPKKKTNLTNSLTVDPRSRDAISRAEPKVKFPEQAKIRSSVTTKISTPAPVETGINSYAPDQVSKVLRQNPVTNVTAHTETPRDKAPETVDGFLVSKQRTNAAVERQANERAQPNKKLGTDQLAPQEAGTETRPGDIKPTVGDAKSSHIQEKKSSTERDTSVVRFVTAHTSGQENETLIPATSESSSTPKLLAPLSSARKTAPIFTSEQFSHSINAQHDDEQTPEGNNMLANGAKETGKSHGWEHTATSSPVISGIKETSERIIGIQNFEVVRRKEQSDINIAKSSETALKPQIIEIEITQNRSTRHLDNIENPKTDAENSKNMSRQLSRKAGTTPINEKSIARLSDPARDRQDLIVGGDGVGVSKLHEAEIQAPRLDSKGNSRVEAEQPQRTPKKSENVINQSTISRNHNAISDRSATAATVEDTIQTQGNRKIRTHILSGMRRDLKDSHDFLGAGSRKNEEQSSFRLDRAGSGLKEKNIPTPPAELDGITQASIRVTANRLPKVDGSPMQLPDHGLLKNDSLRAVVRAEDSPTSYTGKTERPPQPQVYSERMTPKEASSLPSLASGDRKAGDAGVRVGQTATVGSYDTTESKLVIDPPSQDRMRTRPVADLKHPETGNGQPERTRRILEARRPPNLGFSLGTSDGREVGFPIPKTSVPINSSAAKVPESHHSWVPRAQSASAEWAQGARFASVNDIEFSDGVVKEPYPVPKESNQPLEVKPGHRDVLNTAPPMAVKKEPLAEIDVSLVRNEPVDERVSGDQFPTLTDGQVSSRQRGATNQGPELRTESMGPSALASPPAGLTSLATDAERPMLDEGDIIGAGGAIPQADVSTGSHRHQMAPLAQARTVNTVIDRLKPVKDGAMEVELHPAELGRVRLHVQTTDNVVSLVISADRPEIQDLFRRHVSALTEFYEDMGYDRVDVAFAGGQGPGSGQSDKDGAGTSGGATGMEISSRDVAEDDVEAYVAGMVQDSGVDLRL
ncbi:flagellar hook-length control protein FliK [Pseudooceanicola atlanticus]|nr:flagellar hook-length control protein FliK [Pseudooceanicola atlanticus]